MTSLAELPRSPIVEHDNPQKRIDLRDEMTYLHHNWQQEGLPHDWRYLDGIGFHTRTHVDMLYSAIDGVVDPRVKKEKTREWLLQTEQDIKGFNLEYLAQGLTFPIYYEQKTIDGYKRIVAPLYANKPMTDLTSDQERNGVVKEALTKKVEPYLLYATDGSIAVMTSPSGWSGLHMEDGSEIVYPDSQTYIWQKRGKEVVGFTIRTDFSLAEHKTFLQNYFNIDLAPDASVSDYVAAVGFANATEHPNLDIADIVDGMRDTRFTLTGGSLFAYKDRMWNEVYRDLENRDALWEFDQTTEQMMAELTDFIEKGNWTRREVEEAIAVTILKITKHIRGDIIHEKHYATNTTRTQDTPLLYGMVYQDAQELEGCAGGGGAADSPFRNTMRELLRQANPARVFMQSITPRYAEVGTIGDDGLGPRDVECPEPSCKKSNKRPFGGYVLACSHCGSDKIACS